MCTDWYTLRMLMKKFRTIDEYISDFPKNVQEVLLKLRETIKRAAPEAKETISYGIPTFKQHGNLVHFGGFKHHIGFYPAPKGITAFERELKPYIAGKGSVRFPLDKPLPYALVTRIVKFRLQENLAGKK